WSPDSQQIAFFAQGKLKRIPAVGGTGHVICDVPDGRGGDWNKDGVIIFARNLGGPLYRVAAGGGSPTPLQALDQNSQDSAHIWPEFLPDGRHYLYLAWSPQKDRRQLRVASLDGQPPTTLFTTQSNVRFAPPNHLMFTSGGKLQVQSFDPAKLTVKGDPFPIA